ncbi:hypothetical protein AJ88_21235 [Mesorhizobium amorphae CCBAU 01583]|nr:hypothetical protein AJ88_21235 [Mesorhizobium amorphae CCBAU 01583]
MTAAMIFSRVALETRLPSFNARDTVMAETPARSATSAIVGAWFSPGLGDAALPISPPREPPA